MVRALPIVLTVFGSLLAGSTVRADHLAIDLEARSGKAKQTAHAQTLAIGVKPKVRGVLEVKAGEPITVTWTLRSTDSKATLQDVLVHAFVVQEEKVGQPVVPRLTRDVVVETGLTTDLKPKGKTEGKLTFTIEKAGAYLLRLETIGAAVGPMGHEHFAALDIVVR
jgi:hypothetical protein